ncbi:unnamed protein product [Orchesella dallaii]|uniref:Uncharacterized protein n=1 Tax=Orchesella dallaii TaxID=48710 RepID=A0ABP1R7Z6_9HEXA
MNSIAFTLFFYNTFIIREIFASGKLTLITEDGLESTIHSTRCNAGIYLKTPQVFTCACITGVWAFYEKYCDKPSLIVGGDGFCFGLSNIPVRQVIIVGNYRSSLKPSITHFEEKFLLSTGFFSDKKQEVSEDVLGPWVTVTDMEWTLHSDEGETMCLQATVPKKRIFCVFEDALGKVLDNPKWKVVTQISQGCNSANTVKADNCFEIRASNDRSSCSTQYKPAPLAAGCLDPANPACGWIDNYAPLHIPGYIRKPEEVKGHGKGHDWFLVPPTSSPQSDNRSLWAVTPPITDPNLGRQIDLWSSSSSSSQEFWLPIHIKEAPEPPKPVKCEEMTRDSVKEYWIAPESSACAKTINEAIFTRQLERFASKMLDDMFDTRLHSLEQMSQLLFHSRDIMKKTCDSQYVPPEVFDVAANAFKMFVSEDFLYGVEGVDWVSFERILKSLIKCSNRAKPFVFETEKLGCDVKKITGTLILPGETVNVSIPDNGKSRHFEPLIETTWKMFLNAHSYCFQDFQFSNDHHHFSVLFLELFSRSIYENWIEPLQKKDLYKFIVPNYQILPEIMENMDNCVAATNHVSKCPAWLARSSPIAKSIVNTPAASASSSVSGRKRKKRATSKWISEMVDSRVRAKIWEGTAYCLRTMEDPIHLRLNKCDEVF